MWINPVLINQFLLLFALAAIYLGFAGFLGSLLYHFRKRFNWGLQVMMLSLTALIFAGIAWLPGWSGQLMRIQLGIVFFVVLVFSMRPVRRPMWIWSTSSAFRYLSLTLVLVVLWSLSGVLTPPKLIIAPLAALAALLSWQRSHAGRDEPTRSTLQAQAPQAGTPHGSREV
jgi:hypothetical protein